MSEGFKSKCRSTSGRHENFAKSEKVSKAWKVENRLVENRLVENRLVEIRLVEIRLVEIRLVENKLKNRLVALVEARKRFHCTWWGATRTFLTLLPFTSRIYTL